MKKILMVLFLIVSANFLFAELEVDIPFDMDMIGPSYAANGPYNYESDWITITNIGSTNETYNLTWSFSDLPAGWTASVCNDEGLCYIPNMPVPIDLNAGEFLLVHFALGVNSTGGCGLNITLDGGDLPAPMSYDFTFNTEDNVSADNELVLLQRLSQNYPNPFNPSTTIFYELSPQELIFASITIYNTKGQVVKIFNDLSSSGSVIWNGTDENGKTIPSGIYFYKLISDGNSGRYTSTKKMILLK